MSHIRIFVNCELIAESDVKIEDKTFHYLANVMRVEVGDEVRLIDGVNGGFLSFVKSVNKKYLILKVIKKIKNLDNRQFLGLIFAPIQKIDILLKGATELGTTCFFPVITEYTNKINLKLNKIEGNIIEAIEQCERNDMPKVNKLQYLNDVLKNLDNENNIIFFCEERSLNNQPLEIYKKYKSKIINKSIYALIGPEGGFSSEEKELIKSFNNVISINLGDTILRSETATISVLSIIKTLFFD